MRFWNILSGQGSAPASNAGTVTSANSSPRTSTSTTASRQAPPTRGTWETLAWVEAQSAAHLRALREVQNTAAAEVSRRRTANQSILPSSRSPSREGLELSRTRSSVSQISFEGRPVTLTLTAPITILSVRPTDIGVSESDNSYQGLYSPVNISYEVFEISSEVCSLNSDDETPFSYQGSESTVTPRSLMHGPALNDCAPPSGDNRPEAILGFHDDEGHAVDDCSDSSSDSDGGYMFPVPARERFSIISSDDESNSVPKVLKPALKRFSMISDGDDDSEAPNNAKGPETRKVRFALDSEPDKSSSGDEEVQSLEPVTERFPVETDSDDDDQSTIIFSENDNIQHLVPAQERFELESIGIGSDQSTGDFTAQPLVPVQERFDMGSVFESSESGSEGEESEEEYSGPQELTAAVVRLKLESDSESDGEEPADESDSESHPQELIPAARRMTLDSSDDDTDRGESPDNSPCDSGPQELTPAVRRFSLDTSDGDGDRDEPSGGLESDSSPQTLKKAEVRFPLESNESEIGEESPGGLVSDSEFDDFVAAVRRLTLGSRDGETEEMDTAPMPDYLFRPGSASSDDSTTVTSDSSPLPYPPHSEEGKARFHTIRKTLSMDPSKPAAEIQALLARNPTIVRHLVSGTIPHPDWSRVGWEFSFPGMARMSENLACYEAIRDLYWDDEHLRGVIDAFESGPADNNFEKCWTVYLKRRNSALATVVAKEFVNVDPLWFKKTDEERALAKSDPDWHERLEEEIALAKKNPTLFVSLQEDVRSLSAKCAFAEKWMKKAQKKKEYKVEAKRQQRPKSLLSQEVLLSDA